RDEHGAIGLLVILENGQPGAAHGEGAAIQSMNEFRLRLALGAVADIGAPRLKRLKIRAGGDFAEKLLAGEPDFDVVSFGRSKAHIAGTERDHTVMQSQALEDGFGVTRELLVLIVRSFRTHELHQFDFLKLVLANDSAYVFAVGTGFTAEAGSVGGERDGKA